MCSWRRLLFIGVGNLEKDLYVNSSFSLFYVQPIVDSKATFKFIEIAERYFEIESFTQASFVKKVPLIRRLKGSCESGYGYIGADPL